MKKLTLLLMVAAIDMLLTVGCGGENDVLNNGGDGTQFNVKYEVRFLTQGAVKISHKDINGNQITGDPVTTNWERDYTFKDRVDALLDVEVSEVTSTNSVTVQLAIFIDGNRVQQATSIITLDKKSNLSATRP